MRKIYIFITSLFLILYALTLNAQQVSFTADVTSGCTPLTVHFTNTSTIDTTGVHFYWDTWDGSPQYQGYNYTHTFVNSGNIRVNVYAMGPGNNFLGDYSMWIDVRGASSSFYTNTGLNVCPGQEVRFWTNDMYNQMKWNFGTGNPGDTSVWNWTNFTYYSAGDYIVTLIEWTECGIDTITQTIHVSDFAIPAVNINSNGGTYFCPGDLIQFSDQNPAASYIWNFGDDTYSAVSQPFHEYATTGTYQVVLIATNICGNSNSDTLTVQAVANQNAYAGFNTSNNQPCPNQPVQFYSWSSGSFLWSFGDGVTSTEISPYHSYADTGHYNIQLIVTNACGNSDTTTQSIHVQYHPGNYIEASIYFDNFENWQDTVQIDTLTFCPGTNVMFRAEGYGGSDILYFWDFDDGATSNIQNPSHTFNTPGFHTVMLIESTLCGDRDTAFKYINVDPFIQPLTNMNVFPSTICPGETVYYFNEGDYENEQNITFSIWYGDGTSELNITGIQDSVLYTLSSHVYNIPGSYNFTFVATNSCGNADTLAGTILVSTNDSLSQEYYISNSTQPDFHGNWTDFSHPTTPTYAEFNIPFTFTQWVSGMNNTYFIVFWDGNVTLGPNMPEPIGLIQQNGLGTVHAYVPDVIDTVTIAAIWFCNGYPENDPDAYGILPALPVVTGTVTNIPAPGIEIGDWDGTCDPSELENPNAACPGDDVEFIAAGGIQYEWHFGDGAVGYGQTTSHSYDTTGEYDATLIITKGCGTKDTLFTHVSVSDVNTPYADFYNDGWTCTSTPAQFWYSYHDNQNTDSWTFEWEFGDGSVSYMRDPAHSYAEPGEYMVHLTVTNGCGSADTWRNIWISGPSVEEIMGNGCASASNGFIELSVNGYYPITYNWSTGSTSQSIFDLAPGTYTVTVSDNGSCQVVKTYEIGAVLPMDIDANISHVSCNGLDDGSIELVVTDGTPPYYFDGTDLPSNNNTYLLPGTYIASIFDASACHITGSYQILEPATLDVNASALDAPCYGEPGGSIGVTVSGGTSPYTYIWSDGPTIEDRTGLFAGNYSCTVTDANNCTYLSSSTINEAPEIIVNFVSSNPATCSTADGDAEVSASGGTGTLSYLWSDPLSQTTAAATNLLAGIYIVTVTDQSGCTVTYSITVNNLSAPTIDNIVIVNVLCNGDATGSATVQASGGTGALTYLWSNTITTADNTNIIAGTYSIEVSDAANCQVYGFATITQPQAINIAADLHDVACYGDANGWIPTYVNGGVSPYSYEWTGGSANDTLLYAAQGNYSLTVTDANSCTHIESYTINEPAQLNAGINVISQVLCNGQSNASLQATASGGVSPYSYSWTGAMTGQTISGLAAGNYDLTVTDSHGCVSNANVNISDPPLLVATVVKQNISCNGLCDGGITLNVSGGTGAYTYMWNSGSTLPALTGLCTGNYSVTIKDANNCSIIKTANITQPVTLNVNIASTNPQCYGDCNGFALANTTGGTTPYTFEWDDASTGSSLYNLCAGSYSMTVTDTHGCEDSSFVVITEPSELVAIVTSTDIVCHGEDNGTATVNPSGGTAQYSTIWENVGTTETVTDLAAGDYPVQVLDAYGCEFLDTVTISEPDTFIVTLSSQNILCNGYSDGSISFYATGGIVPYEISIDGINWTYNSSVTSLVAGEYLVEIRDSNHCTSIDTLELTQPNPIVTLILSEDVLCYGLNTGTAVVQASGDNPPFTFLWSTTSTNDTITGLGPGEYSVEITDANTCTTTDTILIAGPGSAIISVIDKMDVLCYGDTNGVANVTASGGTPGYTYLWSNATTGTYTDDLAPGYYYVTITDTNNCIMVDSVLIGEPVPLDLSFVVTDASASTASDGSIDMTISGGTIPYYILWSNTETTEDISGLLSGNYIVLVTDSNSCEISDSVFVDFTFGIASVETDNDIKIYPNPVVNMVYIANVEKSSVEIRNILGQIIYRKDNCHTNAIIDLSKEPSGHYFVKIIRDGITLTRKITKE